jgi:hypothetical protein
VQNLVGIRIADAAEDARIGECALERVILSPQSLDEMLRIRVQHLEPVSV